MTNFGALAVLAELRGHARLRTARVYALLTALETFPPGADRWREVSAGELCESAALDRKAYRQARDELIAAKLIEYQPATHRGEKSRWRITFPVEEPPRKKGAAQSGPLPKGAAQSGPSTTVEGGPSTTVEGGPSTTVEGGRTTRGRTARPPSGALTSEDAASEPDSGRSTALEPSALEPSALSARARDPRTLLAGLGADEREIGFIIAELENDPGVRSPAVYLLAVIGNGDGPGYLDQMRRRLAAQDADGDPRPPTPKPPWCGECAEDTRLIEMPDGPARCIRCHPLSVQPPGEEPASSIWLKPWCGQCDHPDTRWAELPDGTVARCPDCGMRR